MSNGPIDIIIPWVDGGDPEWLAEKNKYSKTMDYEENANSELRYTSWDNLHYWFRAVEKFMPWVNKIFFVTWGHVPEFLNTEHPKLRIVKHEDYIPKEYLPTFNSSVIELNCHRILDLSENFIIFNDDVFPLQSIAEEYYFQNDIVCDEAIETPIVPVDIGPISQWGCAVRANNILFLNKHFKKREVQEKNYDKWFSKEYGQLLERNERLNYWYNFVGFHDAHMANAVKKSTLEKLWKIDEKTFDKVSHNRFRANNDITQYIIRYWQLCEGNFYPRLTEGRCFYVDKDNCHEVAEGIWTQKWQMVCINENCTGEEFKFVKEIINAAFKDLLTEKSTFEKET